MLPFQVRWSWKYYLLGTNLMVTFNLKMYVLFIAIQQQWGGGRWWMQSFLFQIDFNSIDFFGLFILWNILSFLWSEPMTLTVKNWLHSRFVYGSTSHTHCARIERCQNYPLSSPSPCPSFPTYGQPTKMSLHKLTPCFSSSWVWFLSVLNFSLFECSRYMNHRDRTVCALSYKSGEDFSQVTHTLRSIAKSGVESMETSFDLVLRANVMKQRCE